MVGKYRYIITFKLYSSTVVEVFQIEFACSILRSSYLYLDFNDFKKITSRPP
jgi:hypothetical protein